MESPERLQDAWRFRAHLDWVELRVHLAQPTQARYLREALPTNWHGQGGAPFVEAVSGAASTTDTAFTFRVQDPQSAASVGRQLARVAERFPFAADPSVTGIEVAFDAFPISSSADLVDMAERLFRCAAEPPSDNRRITGEKGTRGQVASAMFNRQTNRRALQRGLSIFTGDEDDPHTQRTYIKDGKHARFENTLKHGAQPFQTLEQWQAYKFDSLAGIFRWRRFIGTSKPALRQFHQVLGAQMAILDKVHDKDARARHERVYRAGTKTDTALNEEARKALRKLTTAQRKR